MHATTVDEITFTREEFHEKMWSTPATQVARELGCSDVLIGKICKKYDIPKPYPGYWAKLEHGKNPKKKRLPKNDDSHMQTLTFYKYPDRETMTSEPEPEPEYDDDIQQMLDRACTLKPVKVAASLRNPHSLIAATRDQLRANRLSFHERSSIDLHKRALTVSVRVSERVTTRALCIMDALIKRVEKIGGNMGVKKDRWSEWSTHTIVCFGGEEVSILRLREKQNQIRIPHDEGRAYLGSRTELQPSGLLIIDNGPSSYGSTLLHDTAKRRRIEDGLNDLIIDFVKKAGQLRIRRRKEEAERKLREEGNRIRQQHEEELRQRREELAKRQETGASSR